ncbi:hypothetical protein IQ16_01766 [Bradyrhizobium huanghuaihaiense]|uniref:Uncharacterized protein n=1 Tax=Bradyrhizobium huanghuaihaiense TaxID=990078 RepID=A0A562RX91_9BRAD|nr:hypothetical protein [Bradyrhizobium huanghuaihaiense]TWI73628.1 hypothetical protein IQ16_01766 [Bradyrhizobium huanghuaihaiense]
MSFEASDETLITKLEVVLGLLRARQQASPGELHTLELKEAAHVAGVSESQMRRLCQAHVFGLHPNGYGRKKKSNADLWEVVALPFLMSVPIRNLARFREVIPPKGNTGDVGREAQGGV